VPVEILLSWSSEGGIHNTFDGRGFLFARRFLKNLGRSDSDPSTKSGRLVEGDAEPARGLPACFLNSQNSGESGESGR
jgi:hypothetical protein